MMKKVVVDIYKINNLYSGLGQFSNNYKHELIIQSKDKFDLQFLVPKSIYKTNKNKANLIQANFLYRYLPSFTTKVDLWHSIHQFHSHWPHPNSPLLLTTHDLNFLIEKTPIKAKAYLKKLQSNVDRANALTAISDFTKQTMESHLDLKGKKIIKIYNGVQFLNSEFESRPNSVNNKKFFFGLSVFKEKKNFHTLIPLM
ncbi:MAG: glycosyltransferase, partial [Saprospiraceae bacterium]